MPFSLSPKKYLRMAVEAMSSASYSASQALPRESSTTDMSLSLNQYQRPAVGAESRASCRCRRSVARTALVLAQKLSDSVDLGTLPGDVFCPVSGALGENKYNAFSTDCTLVTINYCQWALDQVAEISALGLQTASEAANVSAAQVQKIQEVRGLINHDYLVLELENGRFGKLHILAEKVTGNPEDVGIHIEPLLNEADVQYRLHRGVRLYAMDCGTKIMLPQIEQILKAATDPHYNLKDNNCWDYAFSATRRLLNECTACARTTSPSEYNRLKEMHDNLAVDLSQKSIKATLMMAWESAING